MKMALRVAISGLLLGLVVPLTSAPIANADVRTISVPIAPYAHYMASTFDSANSSAAWPDSSGNNRNVPLSDTTGTITKTTSALSNGNLVTFPVLRGGTTAGIRFPSSVLPSTYTLFFLARFNTSGTSFKRIFDGLGSNWLSGFYSGGQGNTYHGNWITPRDGNNNVIANGNWMIGTDQQSLFRANGVQLSNTSGSNSTARLTINYGDQTSERSDWEVAEVIVYNSALSLSEIQNVEGYLATKYGISGYADSAVVSPDYFQLGGNIVGDVAGGSWSTQMCAAGKIATGFAAVPGGGGGISQVQIKCQDVSASGVTSGSYSYTATNYGGDTGIQSDQSCPANSALVGLDLWKGNYYGSSFNSTTDYYFVGAAQPKCAPLPLASSITSLNKVGSATSAFSVGSNCASGAVVIGFTGKYGSVLNSIGVICGYIMGSALNITGINEVGYTISETSSVSSRVPSASKVWESSTAIAGPFTSTVNTGNTYSITSADKLKYLRMKRTISNYVTTIVDSATVYAFDLLTATGNNLSTTYGQAASTSITASAGSGGYSYSIASPPSGISINSGTGIISVANNTARGSYNLNITVTDTLTVTASKSITVSVTTGVVVASLTLPANATTVEFNRAVVITATVSPVGKITFFENGRAIVGCKNKSFAGSSVTCTWKPKLHGAFTTLTATISPTDSANYSAGLADPLKIIVLKRSNTR